MKRVFTLALIASVSLGVVGCSGGSKDDFDPNYSTKVKLTPEEEAKSKELMAGQAAPGAIKPGSPINSSPMKLPPGKGK